MSKTKKRTSEARKRGVTTKQVDVIRTYTRKGYTANQIQRKMNQRHMGVRRQILLRYVREFRRQPARAHTEKYTPKKYRKPQYLPKQPTGLRGKHISIVGKVNGIEKRVEIFSENGHELYNAVLEIIGTKSPSGLQRVPKENWLQIKAEDMSPREMDEDFKNGRWQNEEVESRR